MYGTEEGLEELVKLSLVKLLDGLDIEHIGLCLLQGAVNSLPVVEMFRKAYNLRTDKDVAARNGLTQRDAPE